MSDKIDTRISPTLHPGIAGEIADYDDETRPLLGATETAVDEAFEALKSIHDAKAAAATNPTLNEFAQLIAVDNHASKLMTKVYASWSRTVDTLNTNIAKMERDLNAPVEQRATASMASEIRTYFRSMDNEAKRITAIRQAIADGDDMTVTAVLGGRHYLSGIDAETSAQFLREWHGAQRPLEAKKLRAMKAAAEMLNSRYKMLTKAVSDAVGDIKVYQDSKDGKRQILVKTITPEMVRKQVKESNAAFAVPV
ncbi:hypothetical protein Q9Q95_09860 [Sphingomonas sp. DG1-23]|uniref:hypothetical protein n=1 Tax=Sphingomonas sp. DG1-23 TaxID=3068316 RepID=UPI00273CFDB6|nr:hypothetical protein [Sphingomonas sp. DG1-23]MDP5279226.1 hypothetical protein [Sphingomonas sp. DG1-23]